MVRTSLDTFVAGQLRALGAMPAAESAEGGVAPDSGRVSSAQLRDLFDAQLLSRQLDLVARELQAEGEGFYTIASAGHEANAAVALALQPTDPALLHYRSGAFYCARAAQVSGMDPVSDIVHSLTASTDDPISGGRHKVWGSHKLAIIPQTSTIASHLPRAVGMAFAHDRARRLDLTPFAPPSSIVVASMGDASLNHSTAQGALNAASWLAHRDIKVPLLIVIEDNGLGISVRTPSGWVESSVRSRPGMHYLAVDGADPQRLLAAAVEAVDLVRTGRRPVILHLSTVRFMGHAGSDVELAYRSAGEIAADLERDPLLATARVLHRRGVLDGAELLDRYERARVRVRQTVDDLRPVSRLRDAAEVMAPLVAHRPVEVRSAALRTQEPRRRTTHYPHGLPEDAGDLTLAESLNAALVDLLAGRDEAIVLGEDVAAKGGVYGVTRGLLGRFGPLRVLDTLLDEQTIIGTALGAALVGMLPVPEIQYLAYLHNAEDQLRGEAATLAFFSAGQYVNGMVVRIAGLAYQSGFGGHFHNDNSLTVLRDIPGIVVAVPSGPAEAPGLLRCLVGLAEAEGRVCVLLEPIALYHRKDIAAPYTPPADWSSSTPSLGEAMLHRAQAAQVGEVLVITFGNGVSMTRAALADPQIAHLAGRVDVLDLRWVVPLPVEDLLRYAADYSAVLVVDESRRSGGVSEGVVTVLVDAGYAGQIRRVCSQDSLVPLGPAAATVLLSVDDIVQGLARSTERQAM